MAMTTEALSPPMRISIIIPTHRERGYIEETVPSVLRNIREEDEVLVVPNGSSSEYVSRLRRELPARCRFVELANGGVAHARNAGCAAAGGDAVLFLDDDDLLEDGGLEGLRAVLAANPNWGAVAGEVIRFGVHGESAIERCTAPGQPITDLRLLGQCIMSPGAVLIRRELAEKAGGFSQVNAPAEDLAFWLRVSLINPVIGVAIPVLRYRVHDGAVSSAPSAMALRHLELFRCHAGEHLRWRYPASLRDAAMKLYHWYVPRRRSAGRAALKQSHWKGALDSMCTEGKLFVLVMMMTVRVKGMLLANGRWRLPPGVLEQEAGQRYRTISKTPDAE